MSLCQVIISKSQSHFTGQGNILHVAELMHTTIELSYSGYCLLQGAVEMRMWAASEAEEQRADKRSTDQGRLQQVETQNAPSNKQQTGTAAAVLHYFPFGERVLFWCPILPGLTTLQISSCNAPNASSSLSDTF